MIVSLMYWLGCIFTNRLSGRRLFICLLPALESRYQQLQPSSIMLLTPTALPVWADNVEEKS